MSARERVREYLRQRKLQNKDLGTVIHGVFTDPNAEMADLTIEDVEELMRLAAPITCTHCQEPIEWAAAFNEWQHPGWADPLCHPEEKKLTTWAQPEEDVK